MSRLFLFASAAACALISAPVFAQQHGDHGEPPAPAPAPAASDHSQMNHAAMGQTATPQHADHAQMDHGAMGHESVTHSTSGHGGEGSGTARLPANETMNHGAMVGLGGEANLMLHGFIWPVYTSQTGPRGDDKLYVQSMAMATLSAPFEGEQFTARAMMSLEPTMRHDGYPNLFATGEVAYGEP